MSATSPAVRPALLFLCQTLPFPPDGGVQIRSYHVLRLLARDFAVTALCFYRRAVRPTPDDVSRSVAGLSGFASVEAFPIPQEHARLRLLADHAWSLTRRAAFTLRAYESLRYRARIVELLARRRFDLVHMDSLDLAAYLPLLGGIPVACTHHNVESHLLRRRALTEQTRWRRAYLLRQAHWLEDLERYWCPRVTLNVAVSDVDRRELEGIAPGARFGVIPNGVDVDAFRPVPGREEGLVYVGGLTWFPNRDALEYFSADILPALRALGSTPTVRWVGRAGEKDRHHYRTRFDIELTGYVDDVRPHIASAACYVVPLRVGGGTRLKILDAWAMGKAVVSTSLGCEGLDARDGENILIRDTPAQFAQAVRDVLHDAELRGRLGRAARLTAERRYSWDVVGADLRQLYQPLAQRIRR